MRPENFRAFKISFLPATCFKGARIRIKDERFNIRRFLGYDHSVGSIIEQAKIFLEEKGIDIMGCSEMTDGSYILFSPNFKVQILGKKGD